MSSNNNYTREVTTPPLAGWFEEAG